MPQKTYYAADAGRIAELQRDIRSGALSASALVERCGPEPRRMSGGRSTPYSIGTAFGARSWTRLLWTGVGRRAPAKSGPQRFGLR